MAAMMQRSLLVFCLLFISCSLSLDNYKKDAVSCLPAQPEDGRVIRPLCRVDGQGGMMGPLFDDYQLLQNKIVGVHSIKLSYSDLVNSIAVTYVMIDGKLQAGPLHGNVSGTSVNITLGPTEHIWRMEGQTSGRYVNQLAFITIGPGGTMISYGPYGKGGIASFSVDIQVVAFHGRSDASLNSIGVYGLKGLNQSAEHGGDGGTAFNDGLPVRKPAVVGIRSISIWSGAIVDGLQVEFITQGGNTLLGARHGKGLSNNLTKITLESGDHLVFVLGSYDSKNLVLVTQLGFVVQKSDGNLVMHGPFGKESDSFFTFSGSIIGFHGRQGSQLDKIGVFYVQK